MILRPLWRRPAIILFLPALALILVYDNAYGDSGAASYWLATVANSAIFLFLSCAPAAVGSAIEGSRFRSARLTTATAVRSPIKIALQHVWPSLLVGSLLQTFAILILMTKGSTLPAGEVPVLLLIAFASIIAFHSTLGYVLGRLLPSAVSVPVALFVSYVWLGFSWSVSYFPLRYLAGLALTSCCRIDETMPAEAPIAAVIFSVLGTIGLTLAITSFQHLPQIRRVSTASLVSIALVASGATAGLYIARDLGPQPFEDRGKAELSCQGTDPTICLYPEQDAGNTRLLLSRMYQNVKKTGVTVPDTITASGRASTKDTLNMAIPPEQKEGMLLYSFATSFLDPNIVGDCVDYEDRVTTASTIVSWIEVVANDGSINDNELYLGSFSDGIPGVEALAKLKLSQQAHWINDNRSGLLDCSAQMMRLP